jgi:hypothetical protein
LLLIVAEELCQAVTEDECHDHNQDEKDNYDNGRPKAGKQRFLGAFYGLVHEVDHHEQMCIRNAA